MNLLSAVRGLKTAGGIGAAIVFGAGRADACPACFMAASDRILPPIYAWCLLSFVWFLAAAIVAERRNKQFAVVPRVSVAILILLLAAFLGMAMIGPFPLLLLMLGPIAAFAKGVALRNHPERPPVYADMAAVGSVLMAATLALLGWSLYVRQTRTEAQFIVQWPGGAPAMSALRRLEDREPASLPEYRYIVQHGRGAAARVAAERIAVLEERKP